MATKKRSKSIRTAKRSKPKIRRAKKVAAQRTSDAYDVQGILIDKILNGSSMPENGTAIENLIYNATPKVAEIGYGHGFSVGRELCMKQAEKQEITSILDRIGLTNALYYPLKDSVVVTSKPSPHAHWKLGHPIHIYEAGVIAGYLSMSTGLKMSAAEKRCIYNGSKTCQFVATPMASRSDHTSMQLDRIVDGIAYSVIEGDFSKQKNEYYRVMAYLPLLQQPMCEQVGKLLAMSGERIADHTAAQDRKRVINNIANYFGVKGVEILLRNRGKSIIKLRYESYNSIYPYVSLPTAMIVGFISKALNKKAEIIISTNKDNTYTTTTSFREKSE